MADDLQVHSRPGLVSPASSVRRCRRKNLPMQIRDGRGEVIYLFLFALDRHLPGPKPIGFGEVRRRPS